MQLQLKEIKKSFGGLQVITGFDMTVESGSLTALIGPNGAGKSTLINIISGLLKADSGEVHAENTRIDNLPPHEIAKRGIGRTYQIVKGFQKLSVLENIIAGQHIQLKAGVLHCLFSLPLSRAEDRQAHERAIELAEFLGLTDYLGRYPGELPHGLQSLTQLARILAGRPKVLLVDEPAAGLNPKEVGKLQDSLKAVQDQGVTIIMVEHNIRMVTEIADKAVVLDFGKKLAEGRPEEVSRNPAVIEAYLGRGFDASTN
ncbi:MAG: ABC transporter ATP-binding protein [Deltaproteobacteria bacterium]|jgi:branched-chain amino acid transport system ATP-binding protein|nr:ABC transporter ATP-binding protein [Deltaproteobacteria bacterium]